MIRVKLIKNQQDLSYTEYCFWIYEYTIRLDSYIEYTRATKRHKWVINNHWERVSYKRGNIPKPSDIPKEYFAEALQKYVAEVSIIGES